MQSKLKQSLESEFFIQIDPFLFLNPVQFLYYILDYEIVTKMI